MSVLPNLTVKEVPSSDGKTIFVVYAGLTRLVAFTSIDVANAFVWDIKAKYVIGQIFDVQSYRDPDESNNSFYDLYDGESFGFVRHRWNDPVGRNGRVFKKPDPTPKPGG